MELPFCILGLPEFAQVFNFEQTACRWAGDSPPMSLASWYLHKADQCARMAKEARDPHRRSDLEAEGTLWLQIAARIEADDARLAPTEGAANSQEAAAISE